MGSWRKVGAFLGLVPDDTHPDEFGDEDYDSDRHEYAGEYSRDYPGDDYAGDGFDRAPEAPYAGHPRRRPGGYDEEPMTQGSLAVQPRPDIRREPEGPGAIRPITVKLNGFGEARIIGEKYREGKPVILDMTEMDDSDARRLVDFAAGLAFALRGSIDKVTTKVFMLLPPDTDVADFGGADASSGFAGGYPSDLRERQAYVGARSGR
jgi:cell division inhibitor SepF